MKALDTDTTNRCPSPTYTFPASQLGVDLCQKLRARKASGHPTFSGWLTNLLCGTSTQCLSRSRSLHLSMRGNQGVSYDPHRDLKGLPVYVALMAAVCARVIKKVDLQQHTLALKILKYRLIVPNRTLVWPFREQEKFSTKMICRSPSAVRPV